MVKISERLVTFAHDTATVELIDTTTKKIEKKILELGLSDGVDVEVLSGLDTTNFIIERPPKEIQ